MERKEYRTRDKSAWPRGAWDDEPDKVQWPDEITGLPCLAVRNGIGAWCGYVGVTEKHPLFGKKYDDALTEAFYVHGGLTFAAACDEGDEALTICHVPGPGESDQVWWLGFDCGHAGDLMPGLNYKLSFHQEYRDLSYVTDQCTSLAAQLAAMMANQRIGA